MRIAAHDLAGTFGARRGEVPGNRSSVHHGAGLLTALADAASAALAVAVAGSTGGQSRRLAVAGDGQVRRRELNYISDVDVIRLRARPEGHRLAGSS